MAKINNKCRLCRREREKLFLKGARCFSPKCPIEKKGGVPPGVHGLRSSIRQSFYGKQLREKQKVKRIYGLSESKFKNYFLIARRKKGKTGETLLGLLEMRLDNVVYRLGMAPSRAAARQLVIHGHVLVDDKRLRVPHLSVEVGNQISLSAKAQKMVESQDLLNKREKPPSWLKRKGLIGKVFSLPERKDTSSKIDESLIVEYYSR